MKELIEAFYHSITDGSPLPIPYREILLTARIVDSISEQIQAKPIATGLHQVNRSQQTHGFASRPMG
jgi:hypothetical protein